MNILYFLVGCSLIMALVFLIAFIWSLKSGQHDDVITPAYRILVEEDEITSKSDSNHIKA